MDAHTLFIIIIGLILLDFFTDMWLTYLNTKQMGKKPPANVSDVYDTERYTLSQRYQKESVRFGMLTSTFSLLVVLSLFFFDGFAFFDAQVRQFTSSPVWQSLLFFGFLALGYDIITLPFQWYSIFVIEEKYGFNTMTPRLFIRDKVTSGLLSFVLGGAILAAIVWFYLQYPQMFWLYAWSLVTLFSLFMSLFFSELIVPLFNKQRPLEEGSLRDKIELFAGSVNFNLKNIYVIDGSKRSTKANAYFTGLGSKKRIVLYDTLINDLTEEEVVAVLAHETGHYKKRHIISSLIVGILQTGLLFYIFSLLVNNPVLSEALGATRHSFHLALLAFGIIYSPVNMLLGLGINTLSRKNEYQADDFAKQHYNSAHLISALKKLAGKNLSNLTPHPAFVFAHYSHPTLNQRISNLTPQTNNL